MTSSARASRLSADVTQFSSSADCALARAASKASINEAISTHWLRHAHGSHAIDRGASLPEVQSTLGHGNIAPPVATCTPDPIHRAVFTSILRCSFDEDD